MPGFVLLVRERGDDDPAMRLGITVTKKIGNAVVRTRMKRRFRALAREILAEQGIAGADHVLIGRQGGIERPFDQLQAELRKALRKISGNAARPESVGGLPFSSSPKGKDRASTSSAQAGLGKHG